MWVWRFNDLKSRSTYWEGSARNGKTFPCHDVEILMTTFDRNPRVNYRVSMKIPKTVSNLKFFVWEITSLTNFPWHKFLLHIPFLIICLIWERKLRLFRKKPQKLFFEYKHTYLMFLFVNKVDSNEEVRNCCYIDKQIHNWKREKALNLSFNI